MTSTTQSEQPGTGIQLFTSPTFGQIRTAGTPDKPLFCATDVAMALGYTNPQKAIRAHCRGVNELDTPTNGGIQRINFITEGDVYRLVARSRLPEAVRFESWLFDDVVPAIRKTGGYIHQDEEDSEADIMAKALMIAQRTIDDKKQRIQMLEGENHQLQQENERLAPKAQYTDEVLQSTTTITFTEAAKELNFRSSNALITRLLNDRVLFRQSGRLLPAAKYSGKGYFASRTHRFYHKDGRPDSSVMTVVTQTGRVFLWNYFFGNNK